MLESVISLISATALLLGSPGPAPLALAAMGATFGVRKGVAFLIGIILGLFVAIVGATAGLAALFSAFPDVRLSIQIIGAIYILYVAFKIATASVLPPSESAAQEPPDFIDGFILNILNPKAYAAFLAIFSQFLMPFSGSLSAYTITGIVCLLVAVTVVIIQ